MSRRDDEPASYLMDYGDDWPPPPEPTEAAADDAPMLARHALHRVIAVAIVYAAAALILHAISPESHAAKTVVWHSTAPTRH